MARWHSLWLIPEHAPEIEQELNVERLVTMARHQPLAAGAHAGMSIALSAAVQTPISSLHWLMLGAFQLAATAQMAVWWRHRKKRRPAHVSGDTVTRIILWTVMWGLLWGTLTADFLAAAHNRDGAFIGIVIIGMAAGGTAMLTAIPAAAAAFLACSMFPPAAIALSMNEYALAAFIVGSGAFMMLSVRQSYFSFVEHVRLRLLTTELATEAEAAVQAKNNFLANMGHELRTPLNAITGFSEMIGAEIKGPVGHPDYIEFSHAIAQSARQLTTVIDDILDLSKFDADPGKLRDTDISIDVILDQALTVVRPMCDRSKITIDLSIMPQLPLVRVDMGRIHQVLVALLSNAIKVSDAGGRIALEVMMPGPGPSSGIAFCVTDWGPGIPAAEVKELLKPFVWTRNADRYQVPGTGLKLPLADQIIRAHGGILHIDSVEGRGTGISFILPPERIVGYRSQENGGASLAAGTASQE
jgi:signal transduction histidine kinase